MNRSIIQTHSLQVPVSVDWTVYLSCTCNISGLFPWWKVLHDMICYIYGSCDQPEGTLFAPSTLPLSLYSLLPLTREPCIIISTLLVLVLVLILDPNIHSTSIRSPRSLSISPLSPSPSPSHPLVLYRPHQISSHLISSHQNLTAH